MKPGDRVRVTKYAFERWHGVIQPPGANDEPGWRRVKLASGETRLFPEDILEPEAPSFVLPIRSLREEAAGLLRSMEVGQSPDIIRAGYERLKAALDAQETPAAKQAVDEIVDRADAAGLGAFVPKSYREERAARTGTVPLLEYLDKLEATARVASENTKGELRARPMGRVNDDDGPCCVGFTDGLQAHIMATQPRATLALIAKLREAYKLLEDMNVGCTPFDERWFALQQIEVPS